MIFAKVQTHPECPNLVGWYMKVTPDNWQAIDKLHASFCSKLFHKHNKDPHNWKKDDANPFSDVVRYGTLFLETLTRHQQNGETLYVNSRGGWMNDKGIKILAEIETEKWPEEIEGEIITISKWPAGKHYYLASNKERIFLENKFDDVLLAREHAKLFVSEANIKISDNKRDPNHIRPE